MVDNRELSCPAKSRHKRGKNKTKVPEKSYRYSSCNQMFPNLCIFATLNQKKDVIWL